MLLSTELVSNGLTVPKGAKKPLSLLDPVSNILTYGKGSLGRSYPMPEGLTFTLKVMASITKILSGKTLATSSTLLKYLTGSLTSRACSRSLNLPA